MLRRHQTDQQAGSENKAYKPSSDASAAHNNDPQEGGTSVPLSSRKPSTSWVSSLKTRLQPYQKRSKEVLSVPDPQGLTLVHNPKESLADIIFVHGLLGSSLRTWSYNRDVENLWLPWLGSEPELPELRIFTFGYRSQFTPGTEDMDISHFARDLLAQMIAFSKGNSPLIGELPLVFVAHSLGGLVVKQAYILGKNDIRYSDMMIQTHGMVFLATPHGGSSHINTLKKILKVSFTAAQRPYINELEEGSAKLCHINEMFGIMRGDLPLISFYETLKTTVAPGVKLMIAGKKTAILGYPTETTIASPADHHSIVKFADRDDETYRYITQMLALILRKIKKLGNHRKEQPAYELVHSSSASHILGIEEIGDDLDTFSQNLLPGTCKWVLQKEKFLDWTENTSAPPILWLTGLPAIGKTMLSTFIINHLNQDFILGSCYYHFFQGHLLGTRTISFFLRLLAFQIAENNEAFRTMLLDMHQNTGITFASHNYDFIWKRVFKALLFRCNLRGPLFWVVDGLDEAESPASLFSLISEINSVVPIKILIVSRHINILSEALKRGDGLVCQEEIRIDDTAADIGAYVSKVASCILPDNQERATVESNILMKASGSFLWVKLALERIRDYCHTSEDIDGVLSEIPEGMEPMYERMIRLVTNQQHKIRTLATKILTWACCSFRPLSLEELATALKPEFGTFIDLENTIAQICGNFIVVAKSKATLIHQTAQQFLISTYGDLPAFISLRAGHGELALTCIKFLSTNGLRAKPEMTQAFTRSTNSSGGSQEFTNDVPLLWYALSHWAYHVSHADSANLQPALLEFLETFALNWIHAVGQTKSLRTVTQSAHHLRSYAKRKTHQQSHNEQFLQWADDLIRLVGRFGVYITQNPSSIYEHVLPFCPKESIITRTYSHLNHGPMLVRGISSGSWGDCLARLTMGGYEAARHVACKDDYFITLLDGSGTLIVWSAETCGEYRRLYHGEWVRVIKAANSKSLVASAGSKTIRVWDIYLGQELCRLPKISRRRLMALAFSPNDTRLLCAYDDCTVRCFDIDSSSEIWCFYAQEWSEPQQSCPRLMAFDRHAKRIAIARRGRPVYVWDIRRDRQPPLRCIRHVDRSKQEGTALNSPEVALWQPNSSRLLILYQDTTLVDWDIETNKQTEFTHIMAREIAVSPDGSLLASSDYRGTLSVWSTGQFRLIYRVEYDGVVTDLAFSPDCQRIYDVRDSCCNVWEPQALIRSDDTMRDELSSQSASYVGPVISSDDNSRAEIFALVCDGNDEYYCAGKENGSVVIYEVETGQKLRRLYGHSRTQDVAVIAWSLSQKYIVSSDRLGHIVAKRLKKPTSHEPKRWAVFPLIEFHSGTVVKQLLFSSSEEFLLISSARVDRVWSVELRKELFQVEYEEGSSKLWIQHPTEPSLLICVKGDEQSVHRWSTLEKAGLDAPRDTPTGEAISEVVDRLKLQDEDEKALVNLATRAPKPLKKLEGGFLIGKQYIILQFLSSGFSQSGVHTGETRRLEIIDLRNDMKSDGGLQRRHLSELSKNVSRVIGSYKGQLVFLDHHFWLCTWKMNDSESEYKRHFFLPKDWLSYEALSLFTINEHGTFLCPKNGEVGVVRYGIDI